MTSNDKTATMTHPPVTPWYPGSIKPVRKGVYQILQRKHSTTPFERRWDGNHWMFDGFDVPCSSFINDEPHEWRGLSSDPKGRK